MIDFETVLACVPGECFDGDLAIFQDYGTKYVEHVLKCLVDGWQHVHVSMFVGSLLATRTRVSVCWIIAGNTYTCQFCRINALKDML